MRLAVYIGKESRETDRMISDLFERLSAAGHVLYELEEGVSPSPDTDMLLSVGGDGTFLYSSKLVIDSGIPVVGVNLGRVGFLSENRPEDVAQALLDGEYTIEDRAMLKAVVSPEVSSVSLWDYALNEITVHRSGAAMLGRRPGRFHQLRIYSLFFECGRSYRASGVQSASHIPDFPT